MRSIISGPRTPPMRSSHPIAAQRNISTKKHQEQTAKELYRNNTCPSLLRMFPSLDHHNLVESYHGGKLPENGVDLYTWQDATLEELTNVINAAKRVARHPTARFSFSLVYPNVHGVFVMKEVGTTSNSASTPDAHKTLRELDWEIGDYLDVAIIIPEDDEPVEGAAPGQK